MKLYKNWKKYFDIVLIGIHMFMSNNKSSNNSNKIEDFNKFNLDLLNPFNIAFLNILPITFLMLSSIFKKKDNLIQEQIDLLDETENLNKL